jgi:hypothetical protein
MEADGSTPPIRIPELEGCPWDPSTAGEPRLMGCVRPFGNGASARPWYAIAGVSRKSIYHTGSQPYA